MQKTPYVFPIIGRRKVENPMTNIEALKISLSDEQIRYIESGASLPTSIGWLLASAAHEDKWPLRQAIKPQDN
ncbi:hypothetical protein M0805_008517 [Coniferiporia weirii]|nr:hypothetical protein M0805_008517 [Coniferiporia weirii]